MSHNPMFGDVDGDIEFPVLQEVDTEKPIFSFSRFRTYLSCPAQYDYFYNQKRPRTTDISLSVGSAVHFLAETYAQSLIDNKPLTTEEVIEIGRQFWKEETEKLTDQTDALKLFLYEEVQELFLTYKPHIDMVQPKYVEQHIVYYPPGKEWGIQGIVDRVDEDNKICDIKTSKRSPFKSKHGGYVMSKMHPEQLTTYAWLLREEKNIDVQDAYIDYIVKTGTPKIVRAEMRITDKAINSVIDMFDKTYEAIKAGIYPPNRTSSFCSSRFCPFWTECTGMDEEY